MNEEENTAVTCPYCQTEPCYLSCEIPAYLQHKTKELQTAHEELTTKYKAAMERIAELSRNNA